MLFKICFLILIAERLHAAELDPSIITIDELPMTSDGQVNTRLMPYVGNGHLASTVFDDAIYVNGVYNGQRGVSHRARVPNMHNFNIKPSNASNSDKFLNTNYCMDFKHGIKKFIDIEIFKFK